jgi:transcriptional regulator with XRE-family HTH domain
MNEFQPEKLARVRAERGWSLREAAKATGGTKETINDLERGKRTPHPATLRKLADGFGVPVTYFLEPAAPKAPSRPLPESPEEAPEEERHTRIPRPEELKSRIAFMRRRQEKRSGEIEEAKEELTRRQEKRSGEIEDAEENGVADAADWIFDLEAADYYLAHRYEVEGITEGVKAVNEGKSLASPEVRSLCVVFDREFAALRSLTDEAKIIAQELKSRIGLEAIRGMSEIDAFRAEVSD